MSAEARGRIAVRAPNHLGDGVMALPALHALSRLGALTIHAPRWGPDLYRDVDAAVAPRGPMAGDVAVVLAPSLRAAWESRGCRRRIGVPGDWRAWLLTDPVPPRRHQAETYAALAARAGALVSGAPAWPPRAADPAVDVPAGHLALVPMAGAGKVREWPYFAELARRVRAPVVFYGGPGEEARVAAVAGAYPQRVGLPLPAFSSALRRCAAVVANDSGSAHFARAVGVPVVAVFGSTVPERTGPHGAVAVQGPALACSPCYGRACRAAEPMRCLERIPVEAVLSALAALGVQ